MEALKIILSEFSRELFEGIIDVYSVKLEKVNEDFHFEIELDGISDPKGAVRIDQCVQFSRSFQEKLDQVLESVDEPWRKELPDDLRVDNYSLEVSSAGTNRLLKIPDQLARFQEMPLELKYYKDQTDKAANKISKGLFKYKNGSQEIVFEKYIKKQKKKSNTKKKDNHQELILPSDLILEARLYLDF